MKKVIKRTPITFNGVDGYEVLIRDSEVCGIECCEKCMFYNYTTSSETAALCFEVHGCGRSQFQYFVFKPFKFINP